MNRIIEMLTTISQSKDSLERLEDQYSHYTKGQIYHNSRIHHKKKMLDLTNKLENFGKGKINVWYIRGITLKGGVEIEGQYILKLDQSITEDEIRERMLLSCITVNNLYMSDCIELGFPRINEFSQ